MLLYFNISLKVTFQVTLKKLRPCSPDANTLKEMVSRTAWLYLLSLEDP